MTARISLIREKAGGHRPPLQESGPQESREEWVLSTPLPGTPSAARGDVRPSTTRRSTPSDSAHPQAEYPRLSTCVCPIALQRRGRATFRDIAPRSVHLAA